MTHQFRTYAEAVEAGYRRPNRKTDRDTSGPNSFGYSYENADGERTVAVGFSEERNKLGQLGCVVPMYPPRETNLGKPQPRIDTAEKQRGANSPRPISKEDEDKHPGSGGD
jgi:hypothetical protein